MYKAKVCLVLCTVLLFQIVAGQLNATTDDSSSVSSENQTPTKSPPSGSGNENQGKETTTQNPTSVEPELEPELEPEPELERSTSSGKETTSENPESGSSSESSGEVSTTNSHMTVLLSSAYDSSVEEPTSENPTKQTPAKISTGKNCTSQCKRPEYPSKIFSKNTPIDEEVRSRSKFGKSKFSRGGGSPIRTECEWSCPDESWDKDGNIVSCEMTQKLHFWGDDSKVTKVICRKDKGCPEIVGNCLDIYGSCFQYCPQQIERPKYAYLRCGDECGYEGKEVCTRTAWVTDFNGVETKRVTKCHSPTSCSGDDVGICENLKDKDPAYGRPCWEHCKEIMG